MLEMSNEIAERINKIAGRDLVPTCKAMLSSVGRLPGIDGRAKASKSLGNAISLSAGPDEVQTAVRAMYTDPDHVRVSDPGRVEGNVVFAHLDAFDPDRDGPEDLKVHYRRGGLGDMVLKRRLATILEDLIGPMRERRAELSARPDDLMDVLREGTRKAVERSEPIAGEIEEALGVMRLR